ncbi:hypothetical protein WJX74_008330 [Apatococcus lobatus]|uniref:Uncharacterized protein n=1 Tax=Apatococcus lobatus TaxID=904363 RepID=A0AAW1Q9I4_9CHLO
MQTGRVGRVPSSDRQHKQQLIQDLAKRRQRKYISDSDTSSESSNGLSTSSAAADSACSEASVVDLWLKWLGSLYGKQQGGILGDDMGLGKTMQCSAFLAALLMGGHVRHAMIVAPKTLLSHWEKELAVCGLSRDTHQYMGSQSERDDTLQRVMHGKGVLLTTYGMLQHNTSSLAEPPSSAWKARRNADEPFQWDIVFFDEGHKLKNPKMQLVQKVKEVPAALRIIISGTPIQNNLMEMHALFEIACPGLLGDARDFKDEFERFITAGTDKHATMRARQMGSARAAQLRARLAPFFLRRDKKDVLKPARNEQDKATTGDSDKAGPSRPPTCGRKSDFIVWLQLQADQRNLYKEFLTSKAVRAALNQTGSALAALTVLKKICDHPCLLTDKQHPTGTSAACKTVFIIQLLQKLTADGHQTLLFSQSRMMLDMLEGAIRQQGWSFCRIDGTVSSAAERHERVQRFQTDNTIPIFLLTSQVGGLGLTLTAADRVIILDPAWNPSVDNQSVDRACRIGQTRDVVVYRLITCGTIEEKIYRKQVYKGALSRTGTDEADPFRYFSQQELRQLFSVDDEGLTRSVTQQQLHDLHAAQRVASAAILDHLNVLATLTGYAGISDHDLLFSKPAEALKEHLAGPGSINPPGYRPGGHWADIDDLQDQFATSVSLRKPGACARHLEGSAATAERIVQAQAQLARQRALAASSALNLPDGGRRLALRIQQLEAELASLTSPQPQPLSSAPVAHINVMQAGHIDLAGPTTPIIDITAASLPATVLQPPQPMSVQPTRTSYNAKAHPRWHHHEGTPSDVLDLTGTTADDGMGPMRRRAAEDLHCAMIADDGKPESSARLGHIDDINGLAEKLQQRLNIQPASHPSNCQQDGRRQSGSGTATSQPPERLSDPETTSILQGRPEEPDPAGFQIDNAEGHRKAVAASQQLPGPSNASDERQQRALCTLEQPKGSSASQQLHEPSTASDEIRHKAGQISSRQPETIPLASQLQQSRHSHHCDDVLRHPRDAIAGHSSEAGMPKQAQRALTSITNLPHPGGQDHFNDMSSKSQPNKQQQVSSRSSPGAPQHGSSMAPAKAPEQCKAGPSLAQHQQERNDDGAAALAKQDAEAHSHEGAARWRPQAQGESKGGPSKTGASQEATFAVTCGIPGLRHWQRRGKLHSCLDAHEGALSWSRC